jgi:menaquinone-9 beta-reductase
VARGDADALVVGAGPAGAATALLLARAGHDVLILDRLPFPRAKACGDSLSAGATAVLHRLGLLPAVAALPHARVCGWRIAAPGGAFFDGRFADYATVPADAGPAPDAICVERRLLDHALLGAAVAAGARFAPGRQVTDVLRAADGRVVGVHTREGKLYAPLTIGADGLRSVVARRLDAVRRPPRLRKVSLTLHVDAALLSAAMGEMHVGDGVSVGIAPLRDDGTRCNVTVVADADRFGRILARDPPAFVRHAVEHMPLLRHRAGTERHRRAYLDLHAAASAGPLLASGPFDRPVRRTAFDGAALVGDAAGYYDPFTGQGIFQALAAAELLAPVASRALRAGDASARALAAYERRCRRMLRAPRMLQHVIELVLARPRLADAVVGRAHGAAAFRDAIISVTGDVAPAHVLLSPGVLSSLCCPISSRRPA